VQRADIPELTDKGYVRATIYDSGFVGKLPTAPGDPVELSYIIRVDSGGLLPGVYGLCMVCVWCAVCAEGGEGAGPARYSR
jgi:hypothetical protein